MAHSAIMSVRITGNSDDAVKAFQKATSKAAAFGSFMGGVALKGVTALWNTVKGFAGDVANMSDSTDKFISTMNFAGIDTGNIEKASRRRATTPTAPFMICPPSRTRRRSWPPTASAITPA